MKFVCHVCKQTIRVTPGLTTGYGVDDDDNKICYSCCADQDREWMIAQGKIHLYLCPVKNSTLNWTVKNWPGSLVFPVWAQKKGRHNIAGTRYDVWFSGPDGHRWHGVQYGDQTQICHCKRTKALLERD